MIVLDTNVVSEVLKPRPDPAVLGWLNQQATGTLYLSAVSLSELLLGLELLDEGRRKRNLATSLHAIIENLFGSRVLSFDETSAVIYADLVSAARRRGRTIEVPDGQIAATAKQHDFAIATRDRGPFEVAGLKVIDPWQA